MWQSDSLFVGPLRVVGEPEVNQMGTKMKGKVVRPGGLELPTFWFVDMKAGDLSALRGVAYGRFGSFSRSSVVPKLYAKLPYEEYVDFLFHKLFAMTRLPLRKEQSRQIETDSPIGVASDGKRFKKQIQIPNENQAFPFGWLALPTRRPRLSRLEILLSFLK